MSKQKALTIICFFLLSTFVNGQNIEFKTVHKNVPITVSSYGKLLIYVPKGKIIKIIRYDPVQQVYIGSYQNITGCINPLWLPNIEENLKINATNRYNDSLKHAKILEDQKKAELERFKIEKNLPKVGDTLMTSYLIELYDLNSKQLFKILCIVPQFSQVIYSGYKDTGLTFLIVKYNGIEGYMNKAFLVSKNKGLLLLEAEKRRIAKADSIKKQEIKQKELEAKQYKVQLIKKYGQTIANKILASEIWMGMTSEMARESWGRPDDINRSVGSWGVHEQWVYDDTYLYFENGKLSGWQD